MMLSVRCFLYDALYMLVILYLVYYFPYAMAVGMGRGDFIMPVCGNGGAFIIVGEVIIYFIK